MAEPGIEQVWIIVHPPQSETCWARGPAVVGQNGAWRLKAQFALPATTAPKEPYDLRAFTHPRAAVSPGLADCGVEAKLFSEAVDVTRK